MWTMCKSESRRRIMSSVGITNPLVRMIGCRRLRIPLEGQSLRGLSPQQQNKILPTRSENPQSVPTTTYSQAYGPKEVEMPLKETRN